jgi:uncharacterized membrane protein YccC
MSDFDLLPTDLMKLVQLFSAQPDLRFPELDAGVLHDAVVRVKERHLEVTRAEAGLMAARGALDAEVDALTRLAQRAHAYLRVYAENDEALAERVEDISLPRARRSVRAESAPVDGAAPEAPKKRGRPRKVDPSATLFTSVEASP